MKAGKRKLFILEIFAVIVSICYIVPLFFVVLNSFKTKGEILSDFFSLFPSGIHWENYATAWEKMNYPLAFKNTILVTAGSVVGSILFGSMAAYKLCRTKTRYSRIMMFVCISPMLITFSSIMIALTKISKMLHLMNSIQGLVVLYWGLLMPFTIFLYHGNIKTVPLELEEAAQMDGCEGFKLFRLIVFPLLKPVTATVAVLNGMRIWNDYLTPTIMVGSRAATRTLVLATDQFAGVYTADYSMSLAGFCLTSLPIILFYLLMQKHIVKGITAGAVKS